MKIKEAETCHSMGMMTEALQVYEQVLSRLPGKDGQTRETIVARIKLLKKDIENLEETESQGVSQEDISIFKKTLSGHDDVPTLLDGAAALKELGLMEEAIAEYEKLLKIDYSKFDYSEADYSPIKIVCDYLTCLLDIKPPEDVVKDAYRVIYKQNIKEKETAQVKFWLGLQLEKKNHFDLAYDLYEAAAGIDNTNAEVLERLNSLKSRISSSSRYDYLIRNKVVNTNQLQEALTIAKNMNKSVEFVLVDRFGVKKDDVGKSLSQYFGCPFRDFDEEMPIPFELIGKLKKSFLLYYVWVPLSWSKDGVEILVDDPKDLRKTDHIKALMPNQKIIFSVGFKEDVDRYINHFFDPRAESASTANFDELDDIIPDVTFEEEEELEDDIASLDESSSQVVKFVDQVLITAFRQDASDIHIEPSPTTRKTTIRFRTDGVCHEYIQVPNSMAPAIVSRLKIMSELDIAEKRLPQDGKIKLRRKGIPEFELRVSTMPTAGKFEDVVLRILTRANNYKLDEIGVRDRNLKVLKRIIQRPYGLILCVGPTGSGKTTTLHAALGHINKPGVKIWTAEDPIEITQSGLRQVQVRPKIGLDFARIMRGFLRLDPDIIMIGEMRDRETAAAAIEASLTGHLVLSTLHTNNAPETLTRLLDMGMNALNISDSFLGVLAQRLVRRLCTKCQESYNPSREEFEDIEADFGKKALAAAGYTFNSRLEFYRSLGCERCNGSGYKGRLGIHELMEGTPEIKILIKKNATSQELGKMAAKQGMETLKQDGIHKVFEGITDIREVRRVSVE
ncbi:MAG: Flp pilus assembly complex ATPase component TadA [Deltaproteobacteria bacterium]|nr:Flp pilus assembly complex ATPase component TadA [Deltaproteobacteria bacterium]MBW2478819.1 Flp pilus assembly complex ATPase component TadA [Deltaproteobacteria bacterium]